MALIKCPECGKEISDKAEFCPHCGCPHTVINISNSEKDTTDKSDSTDSGSVAFILIFLGILLYLLFSC